MQTLTVDSWYHVESSPTRRRDDKKHQASSSLSPNGRLWLPCSELGKCLCWFERQERLKARERQSQLRRYVTSARDTNWAGDTSALCCL